MRMLPCDNCDWRRYAFKSKSHALCTSIFLARSPISLGCFKRFPPLELCREARTPQPALLDTFPTHTRTAPHHGSHTHTPAPSHTAPHIAFPTACIRQEMSPRTFLLPLPLPTSASSLSSTKVMQPLPFPSRLWSLREWSPVPPAHACPLCCYGKGRVR